MLSDTLFIDERIEKTGMETEIWGAEGRWGTDGIASVRGGAPCVRAATNGVSDYRMAAVGGDVAADDRDDFEVAARVNCEE